MKPGVILSMEQALSLTSATLRFVHLGWRVIKLEATPQSEGALPGDPNRYIGSLVADEGRRSYFIGPNVGKESIALNLKSREGRDVLHRLIRELDVDVFCCNTLPSRYTELGIDYDSLRAVKPDLIWAAISAMGPDYPDAAGYDPAIQAQVGYMEVTGMLDGPPTLAGIPLVDLKAGDEVYANVWKALAERATSGQGSRVDVSMMQAAAAWLITLLPLIDFDCEPWEITRAGNEHRKFVPTNAYPTTDGAVLFAIGSDAGWRRFTEIPTFNSVATPQRVTNVGRVADRVAIHADIAAITKQLSTADMIAALKRAKIPHAPINTVPQAMQIEAIAKRLTTTTAPDGRRVRLPPMAVDQAGAPHDFSFPPRYGEHSEKILREVGYDVGAIAKLREAHVIAGPDAIAAPLMSLQNPLLRKSSRPLPRCVVVVGAGTIGPDIGYYLKSALPDLKLYLLDVSQAALDRAMQRFTENTEKAVARRKMNASEAEQVRANVHATTDYAVAREADWAIEAATEDLALKRKIFAQLETLMRPDAWITSNTSSLPAARIFANLQHKNRATVTHFFAPAWRNPVVEVIDTPALDRTVLEDLRWLFCATGKVPLVTADVPCFMLDRVFDNWCNEAAHLLDRASPAEIDSTAAEFVHAGPFFVLNLAHGNPIIIETNTLQADEEGEHYRPAAIFRTAGTWTTVSPGQTVPVAPETAAAIRDRLLGILMSQSGDILDRKIGGAADLELGCRLALGFKSGPLELVGKLGAAEVSRIGKRLAQERPGLPLPQRPLADYQNFLRFVLVDDVRGVKIITIRRPEALNALHDELTDEILGVIRRCETDAAVRGFVIAGYGMRAFSAGADIGRFPKMLGDAQAAAQYARDCSRLLLHIDRMSKPVVAALNGMALGGGLELALRCRGIVATRNASLQLPEILLGIVPGLGAMVVPYRRWPNAAATFHAMMRRAERVSAKTAHEIGIVDRLSDDYATMIESAIARVHALAGHLQAPADGAIAIEPPASADAIAFNGQKLSTEVTRILERAIVEAAAAKTFDAALEIGYRAFGLSACTAAAREGIDAFLSRRAADFTQTG